MREIVLDTETTGLSPKDGHRIIEIGAIEIVGRVPTGKKFHHYLNPDREIDAGSTRITGITNDMVKNCPRFNDIAADFLAFLGPDPIVAHNASFDLGFLNYELEFAGHPRLSNPVVDTLQIAREKFPGAQASLDALCRRFEIDLSGRALHGALLDAGLLVEVYVELTGGLQPTLGLAALDADLAQQAIRATQARPARAFAPTPDELANHQAFLAKLKDAVWLK